MKKSIIKLLTLGSLVGCGICGSSVSATSNLTYQTTVNPEFTINDSISVSLSSANLVINDLTPGQSADSNIITVTVSSNNVSGYSLGSTVGNSTTYDTDTLVHTNGSSVGNFTNMTAAGSLTAGEWGYSYSSDSGTTWSTYNGLPLYDDTAAELISTSEEGSSSVQFKIGAYATTQQIAGEYNNIVNFIATAEAAPSTLYMQDVATWASTIPNSGDSLQAVDNRDGKTYWVTREADGNIWMTQNLDLCIGCTDTAALTSENTNLTTSGSGIYSTDYSTDDGVITWSPNPANITPSGSATNNTLTGTPATITNFASGSPSNSVSGWVNNNNMPYMAEGGDNYVYTSGVADTSTLDTIYNSLNDCKTNGNHTEGECAHYHVGNYYNWTAAIASSASNNIGSTQYDNAANSICPKGWKLPSGRADSDTSTTRQFGYLWQMAGITSSLTAADYATDGFLNIRQAPLFFARGGYVYGTTFYVGAYYGNWWSSTVYSTSSAYRAGFLGTNIGSADTSPRSYGTSLRCMVQ